MTSTPPSHRRQLHLSTAPTNRADGIFGNHRESGSSQPGASGAAPSVSFASTASPARAYSPRVSMATAHLPDSTRGSSRASPTSSPARPRPSSSPSGFELRSPGSAHARTGPFRVHFHGTCLQQPMASRQMPAAASSGSRPGSSARARPRARRFTRRSRRTMVRCPRQREEVDARQARPEKARDPHSLHGGGG